MKTRLFTLLLGITTVVTAQTVAPLKLPVHAQPIAETQAARLQSLLDQYAEKGLPGIALAVKKGNQEAAFAAGVANLETVEKLTTRHLQYSQSVAKMYMATVILQLQQAGRIDLDAAITRYLPASITEKLDRAPDITVRMLLNHRAGIYDYAYDSAYVDFLLHEQRAVIGADRMLAYVYPHKNVHAPDAAYQYSNTHYLLLALIADRVAGDHAAALRAMLKGAGLTHTFYHDAKRLEEPDVVNTYVDLQQNGTFQNVTALQRLNVASMIGDDGIVATPVDYVRFLDALAHGRIVPEATLQKMLAGVTGNEGAAVYGLGIAPTAMEGLPGFGHSGGGLGAGCILYYFPEKDITVFMGVNFGTLSNGPHTAMAMTLTGEVMKILKE